MPRSSRWSSPVEGVSGKHATRLVRQAFPFPAIEACFDSLDRAKQIGAYHALHLLHHGTARLAEGLIDRLGKQGEAIAYGLIRAHREQQASVSSGSRRAR